MATVLELSAPLGNVLLAPRHGHGVCRTCFNLIDGHDRCYACARGGDVLDLVAAISYSVAGEQLHHTLAAYKRQPARWTRPLAHQIAAVLWRHLAAHESCLAAGTRTGTATGTAAFPLVTTVPSGRSARTDQHPLQTIVGELVGPTRERHEPLLTRTGEAVALHEFSPDRFVATRRLDGEPVLLVDDTWTTGSNAQSAAAALKRAGAGPVAALVIGRHLNREYCDNDRRLRAIPTPFDWSACAICAEPKAQV
jgi:predicted amidophosphoribosyltransferase